MKNYHDKKAPTSEVVVQATFREGASNWNTWILFLQFASIFGTYITMNNVAPLFFHDKFGFSTESAAAMASVYGWMGSFSPFLGCYFSDWANRACGFKRTFMGPYCPHDDARRYVCLACKG